MGVQHDLLSYGFGVLDSGQTIRKIHFREGKLKSEIFARFDWQPRALSEHFIVGDKGNVVAYYGEPVD